MPARLPNPRQARPAHELNRPAPGYYRTRRGRGTAWLPALVWTEKARDPETGAVIDRTPVLRCMVDGEEADLEQVWNSLHAIDYEAYRLMSEARLAPDEVPDFGQERGHNSRDAQLKAAAEACVASESYDAQWFRKVALLVTQITACEQDMEAVYQTLAKPLQEKLAALRTEHHSEAGDLKPALRELLTAYAERHGIAACPESTPHWRTTEKVVVEDADALPREYMQPDMGAIKAAIAQGKTVPGVTVKTHRGIVVI